MAAQATTNSPVNSTSVDMTSLSAGAEPIENHTQPQPESRKSGCCEAFASFRSACAQRVDCMFWLSILSVACWSLPGNACRIALHARLRSIPFFGTFDYFGPNSIGCFVMGLLRVLLPEENALPVVHRALCVGFCGSFTTFSSWVIDATKPNTAASAFEELISGITIPFVFYQWGADVAGGLRAAVCWLQAQCRRRGGTTGVTAAPAASVVASSEKNKQRRGTSSVLIGELVFLALSIMAAVAIPIGIHVRINQGHITTVSSSDVRIVVVAPAGAVVRFLLCIFLNKHAQWGTFPVGTLMANVLGTFLYVFMDNFGARRPHNVWYTIVSNGICGALSTVSSFVGEMIGLYHEGRLTMAYAYALITVAAGITIGAIGREGNFN